MKKLTKSLFKEWFESFKLKLSRVLRIPCPGLRGRHSDGQKRRKGDFIDQVIDILEEKFPQIPSSKIKDLGDIK